MQAQGRDHGRLGTVGGCSGHELLRRRLHPRRGRGVGRADEVHREGVLLRRGRSASLAPSAVLLCRAPRRRRHDAGRAARGLPERHHPRGLRPAPPGPRGRRPRRSRLREEAARRHGGGARGRHRARGGHGPGGRGARRAPAAGPGRGPRPSGRRDGALPARGGAPGGVEVAVAGGVEGAGRGCPRVPQPEAALPHAAPDQTEGRGKG
mmetsp:Transcript_83055/g.201290  ORF Transcript_83055/g.201290 Transcript_83055/m.201290 type:complete len:208 (+) Transcript_83055:1020-1643(+)